MKKYYLAYGSNLNIPQMQRRCPDAIIVGTATIKGYELLFKGSKTGAYLTIEKKENASVPVAVWSVTADDEEALDHYEGYPTFYYKKELTLPIMYIRSRMVKQRTAFVYIMHEDRTLGVPSRAYVMTCAKGYKSFGFDKKILKRAYDKSCMEGMKCTEKR